MKKVTLMLVMMFMLLVTCTQTTYKMEEPKIEEVLKEKVETKAEIIEAKVIEREENDKEKTSVGKDVIRIEKAKDFHKFHAKKQVFIQTLLPIISEIRNTIKKEQIYTRIISGKKSQNKELTQKEADFLEEMYNKYKVKTRTIEELITKMVVPPTSFVLGQAALESGWGRSKLAEEGNNLFGMRSVTKDAKIAVKVGENEYYKRYETIQDSIEDYIETLARYSSYKHLRKGIRNGENSIQLIKHLANYSEVKNIYAKRLKIIIEKNNFRKYDDK